MLVEMVVVFLVNRFYHGYNTKIRNVYEDKKCLRRILQIQWQGHISTEEPLLRTDMKPLSKEVKQRK